MISKFTINIYILYFISSSSENGLYVFKSLKYFFKIYVVNNILLYKSFISSVVVKLSVILLLKYSSNLLLIISFEIDMFINIL